MRTVILPSMLDILARNYAYKNKGVKLYELGRRSICRSRAMICPDEPEAPDLRHLWRA